MIICVLKRILHKKKYFFYKRILEVGAPRLLLKKTRASKAENITVLVDHFRDTPGCVSGSTDHYGDTSGSAMTYSGDSGSMFFWLSKKIFLIQK